MKFEGSTKQQCVRKAGVVSARVYCGAELADIFTTWLLDVGKEAAVLWAGREDSSTCQCKAASARAPGLLNVIEKVIWNELSRNRCLVRLWAAARRQSLCAFQTGMIRRWETNVFLSKAIFILTSSTYLVLSVSVNCLYVRRLTFIFANILLVSNFPLLYS